MLGDDIAAVLPELRAQAESMMRETCQIRQADSWQTETLTPGVIACTYRGSAVIPCRVKRAGQGQQSATVDAGGQARIVSKVLISLPIDVCPAPGWVITVLMSGDPAMTGRRFVVDPDAEVGTNVTARRVSCTEIV